jgi:hypothetical protein
MRMAMKRLPIPASGNSSATSSGVSMLKRISVLVPIVSGHSCDFLKEKPRR